MKKEQQLDPSAKPFEYNNTLEFIHTLTAFGAFKRFRSLRSFEGHRRHFHISTQLYEPWDTIPISLEKGRAGRVLGPSMGWVGLGRAGSSFD